MAKTKICSKFYNIFLNISIKTKITDFWYTSESLFWLSSKDNYLISINVVILTIKEI